MGMAMIELIFGLTWFESVFFWSAVLGGFMFLMRMILQFSGLGHGDGSGDHIDVGTADDIHLADSDVSFKVLSLEGMTAFTEKRTPKFKGK